MARYYKEMDSQVGRLKLVANDRSLLAILWENDPVDRTMLLKKDHPILLKTEKQLSEYFEGKRAHFDLPLEFLGSPFQRKVWAALQRIAYGKTLSYGELAKKIGNPKGARAVGAAVGKNPLSIVVPCHRVIGANGSLTGFAGGIETKKTLLNLETL